MCKIIWKEDVLVALLVRTRIIGTLEATIGAIRIGVGRNNTNMQKD